MKVLVACEYSGAVREAFRARGHEAWSADLLPAEDNSPYHIEEDVLDYLDNDWDLIIAHPPCTDLAVCGSRWFHKKLDKQAAALEFVQRFMDADCPQIAIENPIGIISTSIRKPDQIIHPYFFGDPVSKSTCLWLKGLPRLVPTDMVEPEWVTFPNGKRMSKWYYETSLLPHHTRGHARSRTFQGIANAMADQWG